MIACQPLAHRCTDAQLPVCCCRCPYYRNALGSVYGSLSNVSEFSTEYWSQLESTNLNSSQCGTAALASFPEKLRAYFLRNTTDPLCGDYLEFTSQYPGKGPCYPVLVETVEYFNRWGGRGAL